MRENTIAQDYDGFQHGEPWRDDWADQRAIERCEAAREAHLAAGFGDGAWRDDIVAKVRSFEDGSVEFNGYRRSVTNRLQDLRDRPAARAAQSPRLKRIKRRGPPAPRLLPSALNRTFACVARLLASRTCSR